MTDDEIESLIIEEIRKREITFYDMNGLSNHAVDPKPDGKSVPGGRRARANKFKAVAECSRMEELLCVGEYNPYGNLQSLKVPFQDLFRFWWNRCVEKELVVEEALDDIFYYFSEQMRPLTEEREGVEMTMDFEQMSFLNLRREMAV